MIASVSISTATSLMFSYYGIYSNLHLRWCVRNPSLDKEPSRIFEDFWICYIMLQTSQQASINLLMLPHSW